MAAKKRSAPSREDVLKDPGTRNRVREMLKICEGGDPVDMIKDVELVRLVLMAEYTDLLRKDIGGGK